MQEWGSYFFISKTKEEKNFTSASSDGISKCSQDTRVTSSSCSSLPSRTKAAITVTARARSTTTVVTNMHLEKKDVSSGGKESNTTAISYVRKPLRERETETPSPPPPPVSQTATLPPLPPKTSPSPSPSPPSRPSSPPRQTSPTENGRQFVWADKYRPEALIDFLCHRDKALELRTLAKAEDCGNFISGGPAGVGKRTMIWAMLRKVFGSDKIEVLQAREECREFVLKGEAVSSIHVNLKESSKHVEVNLSELKGYEKYVIVELINKTHNMVSDKVLQCNPDNCRAIVLYEADKLSTDALLYIRWLLERYKGCNKLLFCCTDVYKLQPIKSCTVVQLLPPSNDEIVEVLNFIAKQEGINLPHQIAMKIANNSMNNLRQAIRSFEATWQFNPSLKEDQEIMTGLYTIHGKLQNLIEHNVSPDFVFKTLVEELEKHFNEEVHPQIDNVYEEYNSGDYSEKPFAFARSRHEEMCKTGNDPLRKNDHHFMRIEGNPILVIATYLL
ncbi:unnamed protein product [Ilex paraguariensis]|uniref:Replication factor C subunit 3 n=1 Tax=Ilex paraguariensis TaxID=185542 RepID=A0ABC8R6T2_9AQUA